MSDVVHRTIVVTSWKSELLERAWRMAPYPKTAIINGEANGYASFAVMPCGSKRGWSLAQAHVAALNGFKEWLRGQAYDDGSSSLEWVEVEFGSDIGGAGLNDHQWATVICEGRVFNNTKSL